MAIRFNKKEIPDYEGFTSENIPLAGESNSFFTEESHILPAEKPIGDLHRNDKEITIRLKSELPYSTIASLLQLLSCTEKENPDQKASNFRGRNYKKELSTKKRTAAFKQDLNDCEEYLYSGSNMNYDINMISKSLLKV